MTRYPSALLLSVLVALATSGCKDEGTTPTPSPAGSTPTEPGGPTPTPTPTQVPAAPGDLKVVVSRLDGRPIEGVSISVDGVARVATDAQGRATLTGLPGDKTAAISVGAAQWSTTFKRPFIPAGGAATLRVVLQPRATASSFVGAQGYDFSDLHSGLRIHLPGNILRTAAGGPWGGEARIEHALLDLSQAALPALPGALLGVDPNGSPRPLAAYVALSLRITTPAGEALAIAPGQGLTVELPLGETRDLGDGASLPLWLFEEPVGMYRASVSGLVGGATLLKDRRVVRANLTELGTVVGARPRSGADLSGAVVDRAGGSLVGGAVRLAGGYPALLSEAWVGADGRYCLRVPADTTHTLEALVDDDGVVFSQTAQGAGQDGCAPSGGTALSVSLNVGCIGGKVLDEAGDPRAGAVLWSDAVTTATSAVDGGFCLLGPSDRAVVVHTEGFTDRSIRPTAGGTCGGPSPCAAQLTYAPARSAWAWRMDSLELAQPGEGMDLDGDGDVDNGMAIAVNAAWDGILTQVDALLAELVERGILTEAEADVWHDKTVEALSQVDDALGINPLGQLVSRGSLLWILDLSFEAPGVVLRIHQGGWDGQTFERGDVLATLSGTESAGAISVGPQDLAFVVPPPDMDLPIDGSATIRLLGARSIGQATQGALAEGILAGVIPTADLMAAAEALIPEKIGPEDSDAGFPIPKDEILAALEASLAENADFTLPGGQPAISMALRYTGSPFGALDCQDGFWEDAMAFAPEDVGFDLDGDGGVDNNTQQLITTGIDAFEVALYQALLENEVPRVVAQNAAQSASEALLSVLSLESINEDIAQSLHNLRAVPLMTVDASSTAALTAWQGEFVGDGYTFGDERWTLPGTLDAGQLDLYVETLDRAFTLDASFSEAPPTYHVTLREVHARAGLYSTGIQDGVIGFALPVNQLYDLINQIVTNLQTVPALGEDFGAVFQQEILGKLDAGADLDLGAEGKAYSVATTFAAVPACIAPAPPVTP